MGGRRLVRLRLSSERAGPDRPAAEALERHAAGEFNPDAFFLIEAGNLDRDSAAAQRRREAGRPPSPSPATRTRSATSRGSPARPWPRTSLALTADALDALRARACRTSAASPGSEIERLALFLGPGSGATGTADDLDRLPRRRAGGLARRRRAGRLRRPARRRPGRAAPRRAGRRGRAGGRARHEHAPGAAAPHRHAARSRRRARRGGQGVRRVLEERARVPAPGARLGPCPARRARSPSCWPPTAPASRPARPTS